MRWTIPAVLAAVLIALALWWLLGKAPSPQDRSTIQADTERLQERIKEPVPDYAPGAEVALERLTELDLARLPFVVDAKLWAPATKPQCRFIHIRDWHLVPKEQFLADQHARRRSLNHISF